LRATSQKTLKSDSTVSMIFIANAKTVAGSAYFRSNHCSKMCTRTLTMILSSQNGMLMTKMGMWRMQLTVRETRSADDL